MLNRVQSKHETIRDQIKEKQPLVITQAATTKIQRIEEKNKA